MKAWAYDRDALGPPPPGVEVVAEPGPDVEFVVPRWEDLPALDQMPALRVVLLRAPRRLCWLPRGANLGRVESG